MLARQALCPFIEHKNPSRNVVNERVLQASSNCPITSAWQGPRGPHPL